MLTIDRYIHSRPCIARIATPEGLVGVLKRDEDDPIAPIEIDDEQLRFSPIWSDQPEYVALLTKIEADFVAEVESCIERGTVTSHSAITAYLSMWEIRAQLDEDPLARGISYRAAIQEHESTLEILAAIRWGVLRASGQSRFVCSDRPNGMTYIPITRELALVGGLADGTADETTVRMWNAEASENRRRFVFGHPDDVESFSRNVSMSSSQDAPPGN